MEVQEMGDVQSVIDEGIRKLRDFLYDSSIKTDHGIFALRTG